MIEKVWNIKRIVKVAVFVPLYVLWLLITYFSFQGDKNLSEKIPGIIFSVSILLLFTYLMRNLMVSKYYKSMKAVRRYLNFRELKGLLENENFTKVNFSTIDSKWEIFDLYVSKKWIYINGVYVPKMLIFDVVQNSLHLLSEYVEVSIITLNGLDLEIGKFPKSSVEKVLSILKEKISGLKADVKNSMRIYGSSYLFDLKKQFRNEIRSKEEFLRLIDLNDM